MGDLWNLDLLGGWTGCGCLSGVEGVEIGSDCGFEVRMILDCGLWIVDVAVKKRDDFNE
jgi:hypothetical protein